MNIALPQEESQVFTVASINRNDSGSTPRPGEISLAHHGVLFLDELPEYNRHVLEVLREPMESGCITISRAARQAEFPARFQLLAAMNPCPCGYFGHESGKCRCSPDAITRYQGRLSGPLLDRIDLQVLVGALPAHELAAATAGETSKAIAARTALALNLQQQRQCKPNSRLAPQEIDLHCRPDQAGDELLYAAMARLNWSARAYHRVLKVARTIADLAGAAQVLQPHIAEAIQYRRALRNN